MDIKLEKKPWYIRYRYYLIGGLLFAAFLIYVIVLSLGPRKLRIDAENIQIAEVKEDNFMEYVDVEGLIQPILTIKSIPAKREALKASLVRKGVCSIRGIPLSSFPIQTCFAALKTSVTNGKSK